MKVICPHCKEELKKIDVDIQGTMTRIIVSSCPNCHVIIGIS